VAQSSGAKAVRAHQPAGLATRREQRGSLFGAARVVTGVEPADPAAPLAVAGGHAKPGTTPSLIWPAAPIRPADDAVPLDADLRRRHVTVSRRFLQRLEAAREAHVRREVWARDQGRCQWPLDGGGTCGSTHRLEIDHVDPAARGGPPTAADLRILCEPHNKEAARRTLGASWMSRLTDDDSERPADHAGRTGSAALTCGLRGDPTGGSAPRPPAHATFGRTLAPVRFPATAVTTAAQFFLWLALAATLGGAMLCLAAGWTTGRIMLTLSLGAALLASSFAAMVWAIDGARDPEAKEDCWRRMLRLAAFSLFCAWMVALGFTPL
jgi:5-methylcytosine-specific restriction endonuclease McrA